MDLEMVRGARKASVVAYTRYCQEKVRYKDCLVCFFEGEDKKYYLSRIVQYTGYDYEHIISYECGGKDGVIYNYNKIDKNIGNIAFFIDRDFIPSGINGFNLYETPCYSIENLYTSISAFRRLIITEFGLNPDDDDTKKVCCDYEKRQQEFHSIMLPLNAWLECQRTDLGNYQKLSLADFKINKIISKADIDSIEIRPNISVDTYYQLFPEAGVVDNEVLNNKIEFYKHANQSMLFRGKFEFEFLQNIIKSLVLKNKNKEYFTTKRKAVNIQVSLSSISTYADTPDDLICFLKQHSSFT
ncbi:MAG TPA: DUF4435 domain-containing protein [Ruminococcus bromii]|jgi:hypothetical protein|nr:MULTISPECIES: DUF4435 domain-containing protein [Ruminococcus]RGH57506.1 DUF4435 domain-containing protein [Ruminococcus sp. AM36-18]HJI86365.1 DUF4435 domain-containing protein [Ruminococcus bromii]